MSKKQVSIFKNVKETKKPYNISIEEIVSRIKNGKSKALIEKIRADGISHKEKQKLKMQLPSITFSGIFSERMDTKIKKHSGFIVLDFDDVEKPIELKNKIKDDQYTHVCFISPSGNGLKVVIKIPADIRTHKKSAASLKEYFSSISDVDHFDDLSRVCYESYDPEIYYNPKSNIYTKILEIKNEYVRSFETDQDLIFEKIQKWLEKKDSYCDGNKHKFIVKFASACNRFGLPSSFVEQRLYWTYSKIAQPVKQKDFSRIVNKIYSLYRSNFATATFDKNEIITTKTNKIVEIKELDVEIPISDIIYLNDIKNLMYDSYKNGLQKGETTYYDDIDEHFKWKKGELTLIHGIANHGKSIFLMNLALIKSVYEGIKWGIFSPEQNPPTDFYNDLIHSYIGKSTEPFYNNQMSFQEYEKGIEFINEYFYYVYPEEKEPTPEFINNKFRELIIRKNITGCIIDPFNQLEHNWEGVRDDKYLSTFLQRQKRFALDNNVYMIIVAHPKGGLQKRKSGDYDCPQVYDLSGGAMWNNKCDNILAIYKPYNISDYMDNEVHFISQKIKKQRLIGRPGKTIMHFNIKTNRYEINGKTPLDRFNFSDI